MCQTKLCKVWSILGEKGETSVMGQKESRKTERRGRETTLSLDVVGRWWFRRVRNMRNGLGRLGKRRRLLQKNPSLERVELLRQAYICRINLCWMFVVPMIMLLE